MSFKKVFATLLAAAMLVMPLTACAAEGEAEALLAVQRARAEGIRLINDANPTQQYITLQSFDAVAKMADGQATKVIVPSDLANLAGAITALSETARQ